MINLGNPQMAVGIDVGGTSLKCGLVTQAGEIIYQKEVSLKDALTEQAVILKIAQVIEDFAMRTSKISGIGIGFPGLVDNNVIIGGAANLPGFDKTPLGNILAGLTGICDITIDNDANLMGFGELCYGAARGCSDVIFITVGTGIGGAILIDGKLFGGYKSRGSELGHIIVEHNGMPCGCGNNGCLESYASTSALIRDYKQLSGNGEEFIDGRYIMTQYLMGEQAAVEACNRHFDYMATGIASFVNVFSPGKVVVGGGISQCGAFYIDEIKRRVLKQAIPIAALGLSIEAALLGNNAGLLGAAARVFSISARQNLSNADVS